MSSDCEQQNSKIKVIVKIPKQQNLEVLCHNEDSVMSLKNEIFHAHGLFSNFYKLHFFGQELNNDINALKDYGIQDGSIVKLTFWNEPQTVLKKIFRLTQQ
ncbi:CLUMA_CG008521, isoform A, partial [Clunio marinus]